MESVDLGICRGQFFLGDADRAVVLLPGAGYGVLAPLLWFAREAAQAQGWPVLQVDDSWDRTVEPERWVDDRLQAALEHMGGVKELVLITKSLSSLALPAAAERDIPGVWMTPLLGRAEVRAALGAIQAPTLVMGATADPTWDSSFVESLANIEVVQIEGSDHALQHADDLDKSIDNLRLVVHNIESFLARLP